MYGHGRKKRELRDRVRKADALRQYLQMTIEPQQDSIFIRRQRRARGQQLATAQIVDREGGSPQARERRAIQEFAGSDQEIPVRLKFDVETAPKNNREAEEQHRLPREFRLATPPLRWNIRLDQRTPDRPLPELIRGKAG